MKKKELLDVLEEARKTEESATTVYLKHLDAFSSRFNIDEEFVKKAKSIISVLIEGNKKHKKECEEMIEKIKQENKDDY